MEENPFPDLLIDSSEFLNDIKGRSKCPKCRTSKKYYCYACYIPLGGPEFESRIPRVELPLKIDIIKDPKEIDGKSTAVHAAILASKDVTIYTYPIIPYYDADKVVMVYPSKTSVTLEEYLTKSTSETTDESSEPPTKQCKRNVKDLERVVFVDSTWHTAHKIASDERLAELPRIEIKIHTTKFWRHQADKPNSYLATIEAIYYFLREYNDCVTRTPYAGQYDNLLFYFCFSYHRIRKEYAGGKRLRAYDEQRKGKHKEAHK